MALADPDVDKLQYYSGYPNDKVVYEGSIVIANSGPSGPTYGGSDKIVVQSTPNPYGKKCMVRFKWKIDSGFFVSQDTVQEYSFAIDATAVGGPVLDGEPGTMGAVAVGTDDDNIYFRVNNGHHGTVVYTFGDDVFTAIPHDYTIEYALYEVD